MHAPIEPVGASATDPAARAYGQLNTPQAHDIAALAAAAPAGGFASLAVAPTPPAYTAGAEWTRTLSSVADAVSHGVNRPHLQAMQQILEQSVATGQSASPEQLMLVSLRLQEGSAVASFLSQAVNNTRQSLQTLIERS
jgi:hypothetical protein